MYKRIISKYKSRRFQGKNLKSRFLDDFFVFDFQKGHKKDFAWQKDGNNPYKLKKPISFKKKLEVLLFITSLFSMSFIIIFHPFFHINKINIEGLQRIKESEIKDDILGILKDKKFVIFPKTSYMFTDIDEIKNILKDKYPIESIVIKKSFPNELLVALEEKISTIIYSDGNKYSYLGLDGNIVETLGKIDADEWTENIEMTTTTLADGAIRQEKKVIARIYKPNIKNILAKFGDYPILYDIRGASSPESIKPLVKTKIVLGIINWFNFLNKKTSIPFGYIIIENGIGKGIINTREEWNLTVDVLNNFEAQTDELNLLLKEKIDRKNLNYIDLSYPGKVYWK